jgi:hypothetical protein
MSKCVCIYVRAFECSSHGVFCRRRFNIETVPDMWIGRPSGAMIEHVCVCVTELLLLICV